MDSHMQDQAARDTKGPTDHVTHVVVSDVACIVETGELLWFVIYFRKF